MKEREGSAKIEIDTKHNILVVEDRHRELTSDNLLDVVKLFLSIKQEVSSKNSIVSTNLPAPPNEADHE